MTKPWDMSPEELRAEAERLRPSWEAADEEAAYLFLLQLSEDPDCCEHPDLSDDHEDALPVRLRVFRRDRVRSGEVVSAGPDDYFAHAQAAGAPSGLPEPIPLTADVFGVRDLVVHFERTIFDHKAKVYLEGGTADVRARVSLRIQLASGHWVDLPASRTGSWDLPTGGEAITGVDAIRES